MTIELPIADLVLERNTWNPEADGTGEFAYIDLSSVHKDLKRITEVQRIPCKTAPSRARQLVQTGDVLVATVRPNLNGVALVDEAHNGMTASTGFCVLRPNPERLDSNYLFHWVRTPVFVDRMVAVATGASYPAVSDAKVKASGIPFLRLPEQKRIAAILDAADALRTKRRDSLELLDQLVQSVFLDMFGDPVTNPQGWEMRPLAELTVKVGSGATPRGGKTVYRENGVALIRSMNVRDGKFLWDDMVRIDDRQAARLSNVEVAEDDILLNITGASVARVCRAPASVLPARVNQHVCIIRTADYLQPRLLEATLLSPRMKQKLLAIGSTGATRQAITKAEVLTLHVPVPPLELQQRFSDFAARMDRHIELCRTHLAYLDALFASLQSRAFRGEL